VGAGLQDCAARWPLRHWCQLPDEDISPPDDQDAGSTKENPDGADLANRH
jgi:hypothetical protein